MKFAIITLLFSSLLGSVAFATIQQDKIAIVTDQLKLESDQCAAALASGTQTPLQALQCAAQAANGAIQLYMLNNPAPVHSSSPLAAKVMKIKHK